MLVLSCCVQFAAFVDAGEPDRVLVLAQLLEDNDFASLGSLAEADEPGTWEGVDALRGGECAFLDRLRSIAKRLAVLPSRHVDYVSSTSSFMAGQAQLARVDSSREGSVAGPLRFFCQRTCRRRSAHGRAALAGRPSV